MNFQPPEEDDPRDDDQRAREDDWRHLLPHGYAPGDYMNTCVRCKKLSHDVDKLAYVCRSCAEQAYQARAVPAKDAT